MGHILFFGKLFTVNLAFRNLHLAFLLIEMEESPHLPLFVQSFPHFQKSKNQPAQCSVILRGISLSLSIPYLLPKDALYLSGGLEGSHTIPTVSPHDVILNASESLLILDVSSEQTLF